MKNTYISLIIILLIIFKLLIETTEIFSICQNDNLI